MTTIRTSIVVIAMPTCPRCQHDNADDVKICVACGSVLVPVGKPASPPDLSVVSATVSNADQLGNPIAAGDKAASAGDAETAFAFYEKAFANPTYQKTSIERMIELARKVGDPIRLARGLATMSQLVSEPKEKADFLIQAGQVTWRGRNQPEKATRAYMAALELDPDRLPAFLELTQLLDELGDTSGLETSYQLMIRKHSAKENPNRQLLTKLWRKLGAHLAAQERFEEAEVALKTAADFDQDDIKNHATLMELYLRWPAKRAGALASLEEMVQTEDNRDELIRNLHLIAEQHLEHEDRDAAYCVCQLLVTLGAADEREATFFERLMPRGFKLPEIHLTPEMWRNFIIPKGFPKKLAAVMGLLALAVHDRIGHDLAFHNVKAKDRLDPEKPLLFNNLMAEVSRIFDIEQLPEVYVRDGVEGLGLINGILEPPGFILDRALLSGRTPGELAFIVAKLLALQKPEYYLPGTSPINDLEVFFYGATKFARPDAPITKTRDIEMVLREIQDLEEEQRNTLLQHMNDFIDAGSTVVLEDYAHLVDQIANRLAFIICGDLETATQLIHDETQPIGVMSTDARVDLLYRYAVSREYRELRAQAGIALQI